MSSVIQDVLDKKLKRKTLKELSFNNQNSASDKSVKFLINSDKKCYDFDKIHPNNSTVDALEFNGKEFYLIEFKDERVYNPEHHWKKITEIISKKFQSMNLILDIYLKNSLPKIDFYNTKLYFLVVFSSKKSTDLNDMNTLKTFLKEKYGNIFQIDIMDEKMFIEDYINTKNIGI
jgi:hypothetical protein